MTSIGAAFATMAILVLACNAGPTPRPTTALRALELPTLDTRGDFPCAGVGTEAVLAGDSRDPRVAWIVSAGSRVDVVFPYGFSARFDPELEVLDPTGAVVARAGDRIDGGCVTAGPMLILLDADSGRTAALAMDATGLGPCTAQWYMTCNYGIRVEGPGGYDHRGNFSWDEGMASPGIEPAHGPNGNMASTGIWGDIPDSLPPGRWTISFRLWYGSDAIELVPVPGGTPRLREEDPFDPACSITVDTSTLAAVTVHVAFDGSTCRIDMVTR